MTRRLLAPLLIAALLAGGCAAGGGQSKPADDAYRAETGTASYYARKFIGRRTASGERHDPDLMMAAHRTLPFGTRVRVTNLENDRSVTVVINDRGPFVKGRVIDVSRRAARRLGFLRSGLARVRLEVRD